MSSSSTPPADTLRRRLTALRLAVWDMNDVMETALYLLGRHEEPPPGHDGELPFRVRRTLEAGLVVSYCRPFSESDGLMSLSPPKGLSHEARQIHEELRKRRNKVYAHTDQSPYRLIRRLADPESGALTDFEQWSPPDRALNTAIAALAAANARAFDNEARAIERMLGLSPSAETDDDPSPNPLPDTDDALT